MSVISLGNKLAAKYAEDAPPTLRSGEMGFLPSSRQSEVSEEVFDRKQVSVPKMDAGQRNLELLSATKKRLLSALDLMFHSGIVTQSYYLSTKKHIYKTEDMVPTFQQFVKVVADAEKELSIYRRRLTNVKDILENK